MVVGEGWIVVVVGGFVFTDVVCVLIWFLLWLLHLLFVSCSFFCCRLLCLLQQLLHLLLWLFLFSLQLLLQLRTVAVYYGRCRIYCGCFVFRFRPRRVLSLQVFVAEGVPLRPCLVVAVYHGRSPPSQDTRGCLHAIYFRPFAKRAARPCFRSDRTLPAHGGIDQTATFSPARSPRPSP